MYLFRVIAVVTVLKFQQTLLKFQVGGGGGGFPPPPPVCNLQTDLVSAAASSEKSPPIQCTM